MLKCLPIHLQDHFQNWTSRQSHVDFFLKTNLFPDPEQYNPNLQEVALGSLHSISVVFKKI